MINNYEFKDDSIEEFWIAHDPALHFGKSNGAKQIDTGQTFLEIFDSETEWADRVRELGGEPYPPEETEEDFANTELEIEI